MIIALEKAKQKWEEKIAHPAGEIQVQFKKVQAGMKRILKEVGAFDKKMTEEVSKMRDLISQTFHIVVDTRFKVSLNLYAPHVHQVFFPHRIVLRKLMRHTRFSFEAILRISSPTLLRCRPLQSRT